eukprot:Rmarinus@m.18011
MSRSSPQDIATMVESGFFAINSCEDQGQFKLQDMTGICPPAVSSSSDTKSRAMLMEVLEQGWRTWQSSLGTNSEAMMQHLLFVNEGAVAFPVETSVVATVRPTIDVMLAFCVNGLKYPVLICELIPRRDRLTQAVKKALVQIAFLAELAWDDDCPYEADDPPVPTTVRALAIPGHNAVGSTMRVTVTWDERRFRYTARVEKVDTHTPEALQLQVASAMAYNKPVMDYLHRRLCVDKFEIANCLHTPYRLNFRQLQSLNTTLGGASNTHLEQFSSSRALVFARIADGVPTHFIKSASTHLALNVLRLANEAPLPVVLPVALRGDGIEAVNSKPVSVGLRNFFIFPAGTAFKPGDLFSYFKDVVQALRELHLAGFAHNDVRRENLVVMKDSTVKFIDLDRVTTTVEIEYHVPYSIWYPVDVSATSIDWHQLGLSILRECGVSVDQRVVDLLTSTCYDGGLEIIARTMCPLLNQKGPPNVEHWPDNREKWERFRDCILEAARTAGDLVD